MKRLFFMTIILSLSTTVYGKKMDHFNEAMQDEISGFVKNNPEKYEKVSPKKKAESVGRTPASVSPMGSHSQEEEKQNEDTFRKIDNFDNQGIGLPKW